MFHSKNSLEEEEEENKISPSCVLWRGAISIIKYTVFKITSMDNWGFMMIHQKMEPLEIILA